MHEHVIHGHAGPLRDSVGVNGRVIGALQGRLVPDLHGSFCSIPARHDLARRMDANYLAGLVARHVIVENDARRMARALAYDLAKQTYRL